MSDLYIVIFFSLVGGVFSLVGGFLLLANQKTAQTLVKYVTPFAAGALLAAAFMDVLAEAAHEGDIERALQWTMIGIIVFFLLERFVRWFHHHHAHVDSKHDATVPLIIIGDTVHNFIDGIAIAAAFLIDIPTGIVTTLAVAAHEIPQEVGDFGLLLDKGVSRVNVIKANVLSALATTVAAVIFFQFGREINVSLDVALGLVAGFFIYIAVSDIIPSIHKNEEQRLAGAQTAMLVIGVILVSVTTTTLHQYIEGEGPEDNSSETHHEEHETQH
jgi:zinc and cadmium transporter